MKKAFYVMGALSCSLVLALTLWLPAETTQADPPADRPGGGHSTAELILNGVDGNCSITCNDGSTSTTDADNAGDCACDCADFCDGTCTASGGGQVATCGPN